MILTVLQYIACGLTILVGAYSLFAPTSAGKFTGLTPEGGRGSEGCRILAHVPGELLVKFKDTASDEKVKDALDSLKANDVGDLKGLGVGHWRLDKDADIEHVVENEDTGDVDTLPPPPAAAEPGW